MTRGDRFLIRAATREDAAAIAQVHASSWRRTYRGIFRDAFLDGPIDDERQTTWAERLASFRGDQLVTVGVEGGEIGGFLCAYAHADAGWGVFIDNLHVTAPLQGCGMGTALLHEAGLWADTRRPDARPYLWVLEPNVRAARFYEGRGAVRHEAVVRENPGGGFATYLRYAWEAPARMVASSSRTYR